MVPMKTTVTMTTMMVETTTVMMAETMTAMGAKMIDGDRDDDGVNDGVDDKNVEDNDGYVNHISVEAHLFCESQARRYKDPFHCCK